LRDSSIPAKVKVSAFYRLVRRFGVEKTKVILPPRNSRDELKHWFKQPENITRALVHFQQLIGKTE